MNPSGATSNFMYHIRSTSNLCSIESGGILAGLNNELCFCVYINGNPFIFVAANAPEALTVLDVNKHMSVLTEMAGRGTNHSLNVKTAIQAWSLLPE